MNYWIRFIKELCQETHRPLRKYPYFIVKIIFSSFWQIVYKNHNKGVKKVLINNGPLQNCPLHNDTSLTVCYTIVHYKTVLHKKVECYKKGQLQTVYSHKTVHVPKCYVTKGYCYKTVHEKTVHRHYGMWHNSTLQSQSTGLHQPMDWLGVKPNLTSPWIWSDTINRAPPTHRLVGCYA